MNTRECLQFAIETLTHVEFEVQVMRAVLTTLCECASDQSSVMVGADQEKQNSLATAGNTPLMPSEIQKRVINQLAKHSNEISMIKANQSRRKSRLSQVFVNGINDERFSSNTNDTLITNNLPNETANSDIANVSLCKDNTLEFLNKVDQAESDKCNAKKTLTDENEPSTEENVQDVPSEAAKPIVKKRTKNDVKVDDAKGSESKTKQKVTKARRRTKRISIENLPQAMRNRKRPTIKASAPRRSSIGAPRRSSILPKSEATPDPKPFKCAVYGCSYAGAKKAHLKIHMKSHVKDSLVDCDKCAKQFKAADSSELEQHLSEHK